jgi:hypothetical protein
MISKDNILGGISTRNRTFSHVVRYRTYLTPPSNPFREGKSKFQVLREVVLIVMICALVVTVVVRFFQADTPLLSPPVMTQQGTETVSDQMFKSQVHKLRGKRHSEARERNGHHDHKDPPSHRKGHENHEQQVKHEPVEEIDQKEPESTAVEEVTPEYRPDEERREVNLKPETPEDAPDLQEAKQDDTSSEKRESQDVRARQEDVAMKQENTELQETTSQNVKVS